MKTLIIILTFLLTSAIWSQERYDIFCKSYLLELRLDSLRSQIGITETGNNGGAVLKYQKPFGLKNLPYCKMYQDWGFWVNLKTKEDAPYKFNPLAISIYLYAEKNGLKVDYTANIGTFIVWRQTGKTLGHIACIDSVLDNRGNVKTLEANTSPEKVIGSQDNGSGIHKRNRNIKHPLSRILQIKGLVGFYSENRKMECNLK